jgi:hypothetical protein
MIRVVALIFGIIIAAAGGVIAYRALFVEPSTAIVITDTNIREVQNWWKVGGGVVMFLTGGAIAFFSARRR